MGAEQTKEDHKDGGGGGGAHADAAMKVGSYPSNDFELVIRASKELEFILENTFGAEGKGLHERITSVQSMFPEALVKRMRFLATLRNKLIHDRQCNSIPDRQAFIKAFEESRKQLEESRKLLIKAKGGDAAAVDTAGDQSQNCVIL